MNTEKKYDLYGLGHALMDVEYAVPTATLAELGVEKGTMTLIEGERQAELFAALAPFAKGQSAGGSAANTTAVFAGLGGQAAYACAIAEDAIGAAYAEDFAALNVVCCAPSASAMRTGTCLVCVTEDGERTMLTYLGASVALTREAVDMSVLHQARMLYVEGYLVTAANTLDAATYALDSARDAGITTALTLSDVNMVNGFRAAFEQLLAPRVDILFCNAAEALALTGKAEETEAVRALAEYARLVVMTKGGSGVIVSEAGRLYDIATQAVRPVDTTGAGDAFAGAFLYAHLRGHVVENAARLAHRVAGATVAQFGARLSKVALAAFKP